MSTVPICDLRTSFPKVEALLNAGEIATQFLAFDDRLNRLAKAEGMKLIR